MDNKYFDLSVSNPDNNMMKDLINISATMVCL